MNKYLLNIFAKGVNMYPNNWVLHELYRTASVDFSKVSRPEVLLNFNESHANWTAEELAELHGVEETYEDKRICRFLLADFKGIGHLSEGEMFGVDTSSDDCPVSFIFTGANGVGKTSIYSALEISLSGHTFIADLRGSEQGYFTEHIGNTRRKRVLIVCKDGSIVDYPTGALRAVPSFFCSDYDVRVLEKHGLTTRYVMQQLGLSETYQIYKILPFISEAVRYIAQYHNVKTDKTKQKKEAEYNRKFRDFGFPSFPTLLQGRRVSYSDLGLWESTSELFKEEISAIVRIVYDKSKEIVPALLEDFLTEEEKVNVTLKDNELGIKLRVNDETVEPKAYFNTFRLKTFCLAVKVALACCAKEIHKKNFPIVIDDIFDSSDFNHRQNIGDFIQKIVNKHNTVLPPEYRLQMIFFTQDQLIGEGVYHGIEKEMSRKAVAMHILYHYSKAKLTDEKIVRIPGERIAMYPISYPLYPAS